MTEYYDQYKYLLSYINWINLIYVITIIAYTYYWGTILLKKRIHANNFIGHYLRFIIVLPFWILFFINIGKVNLEFIYKDFFNLPTKSFTIDNNLDQQTQYYIIRKKNKNNKWAIQYDINTPFSKPIINIKPGERKTIQFNDKNNVFSYSALILKTPSDSVFHLTAYKDLFVPGIVFAKDIKIKNSPRPIIDFSFEFEFIFILLIGVYASWYYLFKMRQTYSKIIVVIISTLITTYTAFTIYTFYPIFDYFIFSNPDFEILHLLNK